MMRFFLGDDVFQHGMTVSIANIRANYCAKYFTIMFSTVIGEMPIMILLLLIISHHESSPMIISISVAKICRF